MQSHSDTTCVPLREERVISPVTVVGGGAAGLALVAMLATRGVTARLCNRSPATVEAIAANKGIVVRRTGGALETVGVEEVSDNIPATVDGSAIGIYSGERRSRGGSAARYARRVGRQV